MSLGQALAVPATEAMDRTAFRAAMSSFATGVTVVTTRSADGHCHGMTVNSFASVSLEPTLVLVCLSRSSRGLAVIEASGMFGVNVLSQNQENVSRWFANGGRPAGSGMFDGIGTESGPFGCPLLHGAAAAFECRLHHLVPAGDHLIVVGEVVSLVHRADSEPLVFHAGAYRFLAGGE